MNEKKINKSIVYMITGIVVLLLAIAGSAYAYYSLIATEEFVGKASGAGLELTISKLSTSATDDLIPLDNTPEMLTKAAKGYGNNGSTYDASKSCIDMNGYSVCQVYKITIKNTSSAPVTLNGGVYLYGASTPNIECAKMDSTTSVTNNTSCRGTKTLADNQTLNGNASYDYYIIVYINNLVKAQEDKGEFTGKVTFVSTNGGGLNAKFGGTSLLTDYINNLYTNASKTVVTNNSIEYNQAPEVNLMNDRLGGTTSDYDAGNIRYYGKSPNNYIDIGDTDFLGNPILYRIIGLFKGVTLSDGTKKDLIKIIRNDSIGRYSWDTSDSSINSGDGINEWSQADAMKLLNPGYENESVNNSLWWNSQSGTCYDGYKNKTTTCDFTNIGISDNAKNKIEEVVWNTGGHSTASIYSNEFYNYERGTTLINNPSDGVTRNTTWTGKVALMYPSDYGYATDFGTCTSTLSNYSSTCSSNNWLKGATSQWLFTPNSSVANYAWSVLSGGHVYNYYVYGAYGLRPVLYLNSDVTIESGNGTGNYPFVVG